MGDPGTFDGIISEETTKKLEDFEKKIEGIKDKLNGAYLILKGITEIAFGDPVQGFKDLKEGIEKLFPGIDDLKAKWEDLKEKFAEKIAEAKVVILDKFSATWDKITKAWTGFKQGTKNLTLQIVDKFSGTYKKLRESWNDVKGKFKAKKVALTLKLTDKFSKAWKKVKDKWNGVTSKTATITIGFKDLLKKGYNSIANAIQTARGKSGAAGVAARAVLPDLKPLAKGGVLTMPTAALMGEYAGARSNPEIATPQSLMYETIQRANGDLVTAFASMTRQVIAAIEDKDLDVRIGDEAIARSAQRGNSAYKRRTGTALISG